MKNENDKKFCLTALLLFSAVCASAISAIFITEIEAAEKEQQIIINPDNIKKLEAFGETDKPEYLEFYPAKYLFDNLVNSFSFWTQQGNAGFELELKEKLPNDKKVCSIELNAFQPSNTPFTLKINDDDSTIVNGTLNDDKVSIKYPNQKCISEFEKLEIHFNPADRKVWTTLAEVKLFTETVVTTPPPTGEPGGEGNVTKFIITNSKITMDLNDSEVTINTDGDSKVNVEKEKDD